MEVERGPDGGRAERTVLALVVVFAGILVAVLASSVAAWRGASPAFVVLVANALFVWVGGAGALLLGETREGVGPLRASLARGASPAWLAKGLLAGLVAFALGYAYVGLLGRLLPGEPPPAPEAAPWARLLDLALLPALVEEWLVRGVLWRACRRAASTRQSIAATAAVFALLHGFQGFLSLPHRFAFGLLAGWLRARSGSLLPGIVGHFANNALAVALE